jgi:hypothetical protein
MQLGGQSAIGGARSRGGAGKPLIKVEDGLDVDLDVQ